MDSVTQREQSRWLQTRVWLEDGSSVTIFGEGFVALREAVGEWLREERPTFFENLPVKKHSSRRHSYGHSDGTSLKDVFPDGVPAKSAVFRPEGWYHVAGGAGFGPPRQVAGFSDIVDHFIDCMIIERGPHYKMYPKAIDEGVPLASIRQIIHETSEYGVNELLRWGWKIVAIDRKCTEDMYGRIANSTTIFVLAALGDEAISRAVGYDRR